MPLLIMATKRRKRCCVCIYSLVRIWIRYLALVKLIILLFFLLCSSAERSRHLPVYTYASGATNSMRGAAFLSGAQDAIVVDIGGNTTEVGVTKRGFPKQGSTRVKVTSENFTMNLYL